MKRLLAIAVATVILVPAVHAETTLVSHSDGENSILVDIRGVKELAGTLRLTMYDSPAGFPGDVRKSVARDLLKLKKGMKKFAFELPGLPAGDYAVSVHHDANGNDKFDRNWLGLPKEPWGASRDARGSYGPPEFEDAVFLHRGSQTRLVIHLVE
ncbi:MAG: DUF2141 domain-containing protein [Pseudomonadota bacterium]